MRGAILILVGLMLTLLGNIIAYSVSEDYRFFVKKIKYKQEVVYENNREVDDSQQIILSKDTELQEVSEENIIISQQGFTFLDAIGARKGQEPEDEGLPELTSVEQDILERFEERYVLREEASTASLFDVTTEYPDEYREYANKHLSLYMFPTKTYKQVYNIFDVLTYELPYSLNQVNNFGEKSFYINLQDAYADQKIRIVFEYQNKVFGLKIKKDSYNTVKQILGQLNVN